MPKADLYNTEGKRTGDLDLRDDVFGVPINDDILHQAVVRHLANQRAGTAAVKTRSQVRGGGRKPWRQKGTGRARVGSIRSPIWRGGGITFGPQPRSYKQAMPRKMRRLALKSAFSAKAGEGAVVVIEELQIPVPKTKEAVKLLESLEAEEIHCWLRGRRTGCDVGHNIRVCVPLVGHLNVYDVLAADKVIITSGSCAMIEESAG